jgi:hypothetical protein
MMFLMKIKRINVLKGLDKEIYKKKIRIKRKI